MCFSATIKGVLDTARFLLDMNHLHDHKSNLIELFILANVIAKLKLQSWTKHL